ncbi:hypothetical protein WJX81_007464 [Elliptochloris bilobata]|uniref:BAH domain-containing protein n=1 Tax=Elliptochloris bilobata TaxID=381761 RepID=A0AAW1RU20_9CHLO
MTRKRQRTEGQPHEQGPAQLLGAGCQGPHGVEYAGFQLQGRRYYVGDTVLLRAASLGRPPYIARLQAVRAPARGPPEAAMRWFYRAPDVQALMSSRTARLEGGGGDAAATAADEVFFTSETEAQPLASVLSPCEVLGEAAYAARLHTRGAHADSVFLCRRRFTASSGQVGPLLEADRAALAAAADPTDPTEPTPALPATPNAPGEPAAEQSNAAAAAAGAEPHAIEALLGTLLDLEERLPHQAMCEGWQRERAAWAARALAARTPRDAAEAAVELLDWVAMDRPPGSEVDGWERRIGGAAGKHGAQHAKRARGAPDMLGGPTGGPAAHAAPVAAAELPAEYHGRWARERYQAARDVLVTTLQRLQAAAGQPHVLRSALREEARRSIGDTGLLDHLLKHLTEQVVTPAGERLMRRHNTQGHMEYWLQIPAAPSSAEELREENAGLEADLQEVRKARRLCEAARREAAAVAASAAAVLNQADRAREQTDNSGSPAQGRGCEPQHASPPLALVRSLQVALRQRDQARRRMPAVFMAGGQ